MVFLWGPPRPERSPDRLPRMDAFRHPDIAPHLTDHGRRERSPVRPDRQPSHGIVHRRGDTEISNMARGSALAIAGHVDRHDGQMEVVSLANAEDLAAVAG